MEESKAAPICTCGIQSARRISRSIKNPNRVFYACAQGQQCKFFQWEDEIESKASTNLELPIWPKEQDLLIKISNWQSVLSPEHCELAKIGSEFDFKFLDSRKRGFNGTKFWIKTQDNKVTGSYYG
jgi:hypothetical protein